MFGLRLKSWMESHLGRPRQKSNHQNQKSSRGSSSKDTTAEDVGSSTGVTLSSSGQATTSLNGNSEQQNSNNLESSPSSEFSSATSPSTSSSVQIQSESQTAQLQKQDLQTKDYKEGKLAEHDQRATCTRSSTTGSVSNSTSHNILLGSFCNNLSSPDTGYGSPDGYSPKSVYPALSFESSGKSTPKSSYTISSLVSSELHLSSSKHTTPSLISSASCSVHNGLSDHECSSPFLNKISESDLPSQSEVDDVVGESKKSQGNPSTEKTSHSHSISHDSIQPREQDQESKGNDTVTDIQCHSTKSSQSVTLSGEFLTSGESSMVAAKHSLSNFGSQNRPDNKETCGSDDFSRNPFRNSGNQIQSSSSPLDSNHKRRESFEDHKTRITSPDSGEGSSSGNLSSVLTANRNIRTSFVLVTTATNHIAECNNSLKNAFSISSPRKRTQIKTNPWITLNQNLNDGNSNANVENNSVVHRPNGVHKQSPTPPLVLQTITGGGMEKATHKVTTCQLSSDNNNMRQPEINNHKSCSCETEVDHNPTESSNIVYRISTSTSATSDSGKGSLGPGTNRNSTESSSIVLSESASRRNSIISHETEIESRSSSSSYNEHVAVASSSFIPNTTQANPKFNNKTGVINKQQQNVSSTSSSSIGVNAKKESIVSSVRTPPIVPKRSSKAGYSNNNINTNYNDYSHISEPKSEQDATSTSITLPPELITTTSVIGHNVMGIDKETEILSDWADTSEDGEHEIDDDRVTPTPSSPDTGRAIFHNSHSTSSVTDIDFGDSSAATAASSTGIAPSSSIFRHHFTPNNGNGYKGNNNTSTLALDPHHHHLTTNIVMNPSTSTCYQAIQIPPMQPHNFHLPEQDDEHREECAAGGWIQSENHVHLQNDLFLSSQSRVMCPTGYGLGISNANISLSSLYSNGSEPNSDYANKPSSSITRGAFSFLRKIFKKGSCSSQRASPKGDKVKITRSSKSKDSHLDNIHTLTGLRSSLLTADALVSPHPLVARKPSINGYFLTPTPNAFRRRSGTGTDSSDSNKASKHHHKSVKTDIIRVPVGALSPTTQHHHDTNNIMQHSSSSTASSKNISSTGALFMTEKSNNLAGNGNNNRASSSSTASSIHSMSTSVSATSVGENNANGKNCRQNQSRLNDNSFYLNSTSRQSPFMSKDQKKSDHRHQIGTTIHSTSNGKPQLPAQPPIPPMPRERDFSVPSSRTGPSPVLLCPYESPRLQHPHQHRINSPSFNNYSPIHRLVVTGGLHCNPSPVIVNPISESPHLPLRKGESSRNHNNNNSTFTPNATNRSFHPTTNVSPSPLINHHQHQQQSSISSPRPPYNNSHTFASPSPILRNPKYQYIASSNQNSPVLNNGPKRTSIVPPSNHQHYYYHNKGHEGPFPQNPNGLPPPSFSTFSPSPPPRQNPQTNNNPFSVVSPNLNHHGPQPQHHFQNSPIIRSRQSNRSVVDQDEFEIVNSPNPVHRETGNIHSSSPLSQNRNNILSRSQSYQTNQVHYYASPVVSQPPQTQQRMHPTSLKLNEPPLLMRAHLHNQNARLNNFLMNKQRHQQSNGSRRFSNSESLYEEIPDACEFDDHHQQGYTNNSQEQRFSRLPTAVSDPEGSGFQFSNNKNKSQQNSESKRSKNEFYSQRGYQNFQQPPRPPVPMALFGPNTFLSETESSLLDSVRETEKYERLMSQAEELLREISAVKSQQPWPPQNRIQQRLIRHSIEDCPQSDPLRRKAYDCWALRRLQQELAGCCASPPVLHRSRMNLQSPGTPTAAAQFFIPPSHEVMMNNTGRIDDNQNNSHF